MKTYPFPRTSWLLLPVAVLTATLLTNCQPDASASNTPDSTSKQVDLLATATFDTAKLVPVTNEMNLTGKVTFNQDKVVKVFPLVGGHIENVKADLGDYVKAGQELAIIRSGEMADLEQQSIAARGQLAIAQKNNQVTEDMVKSGLSSQRDLVSSREQLQAAKGEMNRINERRSILGGRGSSVYVVKAPVSGFVVEKSAATGMEIRSDDPENLFTISNLDHVWVIANVYESDVAHVHEGDLAHITTLAYPDQVYQGRIDKVFNVLDPDSKTEKVRITLVNPTKGTDNIALKPEMFANVSVQYAGRDRRTAIPAKSIVFADNRNYVVVADAKNRPVVREIDPFKTIGTTTYLNGGIQPGERVVTQNQLLIFKALNN
ncbi:efflux RND transporter periplasmic adaptor subunit [Spirosoma sp. BT702]|uniref:Efflux RND transporter periplasmic adaptor subunit n=1 Tax=Spirosoma profusum TaxID=2771354 RepID=A0A927ATZ9_9BACT|nr:efflux RND transporter periplasmic adaptor subunit [Spirosoma profusum]MBD2701697.1 efflux RND transporter periplasmic adaptor subunit [Spirosoma profusum]